MARNRARRALVGALVCAPLVLLGAAPPPPPSLSDLVAATKSTDEATRIKAIHDLGASGSPAAVPVLVKLLKSESPVDRAYAVKALGQIGGPAKSAAKEVIDLLGDPHPVVRRQAIGALQGIRPGPKVSVPLFVKLMQDADPGVRMNVMAAVADAKGAAVPAMIEALNNDAAAYWACLILRDIGPDAKDAVPALVAKLKDKRPEIRREAILALAAIGSPEAAPQIAPLLKDPDARTGATYALGVLGRIPPEAESVVRAGAESDDKLLATTSLWALARVHPKDVKLMQRAMSELVARLSDDDPFVRAAAARALAALPPNPQIAIPIFEKAFAAGDETTRHYMLDALAGLGPQAVPRLIAALEHAPMRAQVASILGRIGPPAAPATKALAKLVNDADPNVAIEATHALARIGPPAKDAVPALVEALKDGEGKPRHAAAYALGTIGPDAAAAEPVLLEVMKDSDDSVALLAAWALVQIRGPSSETAAKVLSELVGGLGSPLAESRRMAAETLGRLGKNARSAAPQLRRAAQDADPGVRAAAAKALESVGG